MASSSSSSAAQPLKYDVFLNFRGEDTRSGFISHLYAALDQKGLQIFFDDDALKKGEEIAPSLLRAIQNSTVAILVFSKDYASSRWCLDELVEIIECHSHGQIVIPIFYKVDPSHLRHQCYDVASSFVKHEQNSKNPHKITRWRDALTKAANLSGFDSKEFRNDDLLVKKIAEVVLEKVNPFMPCDDFKDLVGMNSRIKKIKEAFTINPSETCILGIWGMGGAGKTTTANVIYKMMSPQFHGHCFVENVRQVVEASGINKLQEEFISKILGEKDSQIYTLNFLKRRLGSKKVLIVLDDVKDSLQLEDLIGDLCWFGSGSRILVTSRNKQVFKRRANFMYEVKLLNDNEALQLFNKSAFKQNYPGDDCASLSKSIVQYAQGNPLALKVLGSALIGRSKEEWKSALHQLSTVPNKDIHHVLKISYDSLNRVEKDLFLDIACFFKHVGQIYVDQYILRKIYESSGFDITLSVLMDKCLVTSKYPLDMHDLLQEMGKEIVRQEAKYSYQRSRLWDPQDIYEVFAGHKEAEAVETITLDLSKIRKMNLNSQVFKKMPNLRFLDFYGESNLNFSQGLDYLPNTLQYLRWDKYPLEFLPPNFQQDSNLVVLELPNSNIKQLLKEDSLVSGIANGFQRLTSLSLVWNKGITHLPSGFLEALEDLDLRGCSNLNTFPEISSNIKRLYLAMTAIRQIPSSSVERLNKLEDLSMWDCRELESLPSNFFSKLTSLLKLNLSGCSRFKALPEILTPRSHGVFLNLRETAIEKLPSFIGNFNGSWIIDMSKCRKLAFYPRSSKTCFPEDSFYRGDLDLDLSKCNLKELPEDLSFLSFIQNLNLSENDFERIPATFKQISQLESLTIDYCERLLSLPELPSNVRKIFAYGCGSLKEIWTLTQLPLNLPAKQEPFNPRLSDYEFCFWHCLKLDEDECHEVVNTLLRNYTRSQMQESLASFEMVYPGSRIPEWVKYQNLGNSIQIYLPSYWFNHLFLGFAFFLCVDFDGEWFDYEGGSLHYDCYFGDNYHFSSDFLEEVDVDVVDKEHMIVFVHKRFCEWVRRHSNFEEDEVIFKFTMGYAFDYEPVNRIKECGVIPLYVQKDDDEFSRTFDFPNLGGSKLKRSVTSAGSFYCMPKKRLKIEEIE